MIIRSIEARDHETWRRLFHAYGVFYETEFDDEVLDRVWALLGDEASGIDAIVAEQGGAIVGFAHYRSHYDTFTGGRDWYLEDLYVHPDARGAGIATALIERLAELARETDRAGSLRWITAADNTRAQRIYDRLATRTTWVTYEKRLEP
jgi:ribosomal protein S18 acetylase RimI-like enzyme